LAVGLARGSKVLDALLLPVFRPRGENRQHSFEF
jgi:hypothetical protein